MCKVLSVQFSAVRQRLVEYAKRVQSNIQYDVASVAAMLSVEVEIGYNSVEYGRYLVECGRIR